MFNYADIVLSVRTKRDRQLRLLINRFRFLMLSTRLVDNRHIFGWLSRWGVVAERSSLLDSSSGVSSRMWVRIPVVTLVSLSKTLNHNCFVLRMGRKAVGPVCCVMHVKEPRTLIVKEKGLAPVFLEWQLNAPKLIDQRLWMGPQILCALLLFYTMLYFSINNPIQVYIYGKLCFFSFIWYQIHLIYGQVGSRSRPK